jgi:uncharacterized protein YndB with AHSA1/START domain
MSKFSIAIEIDAPRERVWQVMSDVERWHEWTASIKRVRRLGSGPFAVGSRVLIRQPKLPPAFWKIAAIEPGKSFTWISASPGFRAIGYHAVESIPGGSRATLSIEFQGMFGGVFARMTRGITERYLDFEAKGLKARSEDPAFRRATTESRLRVPGLGNFAFSLLAVALAIAAWREQSGHQLD